MKINTVINGDSLEIIKDFPDNSMDSLITDPPYGISFMNKKWDYDIPSIELWKEVFRVLKPGAHGLVACGTRTQHRMAVSIEDAGFEIRDVVAWVYGSGFPKSLNIGKAIDKLQGNQREFVSKNPANIPYNITKGETSTGWKSPPRPDKTKGNSPYEGYGTALKPAMEFFTLIRKPISEKNIAENVIKHGTGGINIDRCWIGDGGQWKWEKPRVHGWKGFNDNGNNTNYGKNSQGRFPANLIHDGSDEVISLFPNNENRFFYCAKVSKNERNEGLDGFEKKFTKTMNDGIGEREHNENEESAYNANHHPTVKPISLMRYLCKLITPKNGIVLDPFLGSGSTAIGAILESFNYIGIEREKEYCDISNARINYWKNKIIEKNKYKNNLEKFIE